MKIFNTLNLSLPLIQAPLDYYPNQTTLVAKVSQHGALGVYASACQSLTTLSRAVDDIQLRCDQAFAVSVDVGQQPAELDLADRSSASNYLSAAQYALGIDNKEAPALPNYHAVTQLLIEKRPAAVIFYNGLPDNKLLRDCQHAGMITFVIAGNILEALAITNSAADAVILQGLEAAGTHSRFNNEFNVPDYPISTLLQHAVKHISKPLIVWGDYNKPANIAAALLNGAQAVVVDTPFWTTRESPIPDSYRRALADCNEMQTTQTTLWNGYPARVIKNALTKHFSTLAQITPQASKQQRILQPTIQAAIAQDAIDYMPLWAGLCVQSSHNRTVSELCQRYTVQLSELI